MQSRPPIAGLCAIACALVPIVPPSSAQGQAGGTEPPEWTKRWKAIAAVADDPSTTPEQKVPALIGLLTKEVSDPVPGGGQSMYTPSEQLQEPLIMALSQAAPPEVLRSALADPGNQEPELHARLELAYAGSVSRRGPAVDPALRATATDACANLLKTNPSDFVRMIAARSLGELESREHTDALIAALSDPAGRPTPASMGGDPTARVYIVRNQAAGALMSIGHDVRALKDGSFILDPPLVTGVDGVRLLRNLGLEVLERSVGPCGVAHLIGRQPDRCVTLGVFANVQLVADRLHELDGFLSRYHAPDRIDIGDTRIWRSESTLAFARGNVLCVVRSGSREDCEELARRMDQELQTESELVKLGKEVPVPNVTVDVPSEARPGQLVALTWRTDDEVGLLSAPYGASLGSIADTPAREGQTGLQVHETEPGLMVRRLSLATPTCVVVTRTVTIKVVPWE